MKTYDVYFVDTYKSFSSPIVKVKAPDFVAAVAKVVAKYPDREIRGLELDRESEDEIID